jgi:hypothetical protein
LMSCQKKSNSEVKPSEVMITINDPTDLQVYHSGDTVFVNAHVSYTSELHGYDLAITDTVSNTVLYEHEEHVHKDEFDIAEYWRVAVTSAIVARVSIVAAIDHNGEEVKKDLIIKLEP